MAKPQLNVPFSALDDAAAAALFPLARSPDEHMGALYADGADVARTPTISTGSNARVGGTLKFPAGSLRGLFHNHPAEKPTGVRDYDRGADMARTRDRFSNDDRLMAERLAVPSYISAGDTVMRYDPGTKSTSEVLAQYPWDEMRRRIMVEILERDINDSRGLKR